MQAVSQEVAELLESQGRIPRIYAFMQLPLVVNPTANTYDYSKLGAQLVLDNIESFQMQKIYEPGSDNCDISFTNPASNLYSPISMGEAPLGKFFFPGAVDNKIQIYSGIVNLDGTTTLYPMGIFISKNFKQDVGDGQNNVTINTLDQFQLFQQYIESEFPPVLYGNQSSSYYTAPYALQNPSGDLMTYVCDAVNWMEESSQAPAFASEFLPVTVYVGTASAPATAPTTNTLTINYVEGIVTFASPLASGSIVSVDARPLGMAPELMLKHLVVDNGAFDPSFLKFDQSGVVIGIVSPGVDSPMYQAMIDIASATAPRGVQWTIFFDEEGYLCFQEKMIDGKVVATFTDDKDILKLSPEFTVNSLSNAVRAQATASNQQPITLIAYNTDSIGTFSQTAIYDIDSDILSCVIGMDPGSAVTFLSGLTNGTLFELDTPDIQTEVEVLYNPALQTGDCISIRDSKSGINTQFYVQQITTEIAADKLTQTLRLKQFKYSQDFLFGITSINAPVPNNPNTFQGNTGLLSDITIAGTTVLSSGNPVLDSNFNYVLAQWNGGSLPIDIGIVQPPTSCNIYIWRWIYIAEDAYCPYLGGAWQSPLLLTGNAWQTDWFSYASSAPTAAQVLDLSGAVSGLGAASTLPYDFRANLDTQTARRYYRPLLRPSDWVSNDGKTAYTSAQTLSSTWTGGPGVTAGLNNYLYGNLKVGASDLFGNTTAGFVGVQLFGPNTQAAINYGISSLQNYGMDFGLPIPDNAQISYGIQNKKTTCYLGILVACDSGVVQIKKIPFQLAI